MCFLLSRTLHLPQHLVFHKPFLLLDAQFARLDTVLNRHPSILSQHLPAKQRISISSSHNAVLRFVYSAFPGCKEHAALSANVVAVQGST